MVLWGLLAGAIAAGCTTTAELPLSGGSAGGGTTAGAGGGPAGGAVGAVNGGAGAAPSTAGTASSGPSYLPVRIRRLTDDEWQASATALFGVTSMTAASFTPDSTQTGFAVNDGQEVDPVFAGQVAGMIREERRARRAPAGADADALATVLLELNDRALEAYALGAEPPRAQRIEALTSIWLRSIYVRTATSSERSATSRGRKR